MKLYSNIIFRLELTCPGTAILKGLSDLKIYPLSLDIRDLKFRIAFDVKTLVLESPYKIEGVIKNILPVFGQGIAKYVSTTYVSSPALSSLS